MLTGRGNYRIATGLDWYYHTLYDKTPLVFDSEREVQMSLELDSLQRALIARYDAKDREDWMFSLKPWPFNTHLDALQQHAYDLAFAAMFDLCITVGTTRLHPTAAFSDLQSHEPFIATSKYGSFAARSVTPREL